MPIHLFLASQSPRRRELLRQIGREFDVLDVDVPERREPNETPEDYVSRVAREKAGAGLMQVAAVHDAVVIGADTEVVLDDDVFGKPADATDAATMLRRLSGRSHRVLSAVWCISAGREEHALSVSTVEFAPMTDADVADYIATGEAFGKAGAYAIQGHAAAYIRRLDGSHSAVMGLPLHETSLLLRRFERA
jgi:septum formation protein